MENWKSETIFHQKISIVAKCTKTVKSATSHTWLRAEANMSIQTPGSKTAHPSLVVHLCLCCTTVRGEIYGVPSSHSSVFELTLVFWISVTWWLTFNHRVLPSVPAVPG